MHARTNRMHEPVDATTVKWDAWASLETLKEVVSALIFLHEHNILHGDLKAANVLLASSEEDRRRWIAKVCVDWYCASRCGAVRGGWALCGESSAVWLVGCSAVQFSG
jgi:Ser/Thr protein kinase RdoA (MazF antagonist)